MKRYLLGVFRIWTAVTSVTAGFHLSAKANKMCRIANKISAFHTFLFFLQAR